MLRRRLGWKRVGHAGTLDPSASGVLLILCGDATRRTEEFMDLPKEYVARIRFGFTTTTDDFEGDVLTGHPIDHWDDAAVKREVESLVDVKEQTPPAISAIKLGGRRSYRIARSGGSPVVPSRPVNVYQAQIIAQHPPEIELLVRCSRGTYIRSIARDLGHRLGWGGTLASLVRTAIGPYRIEQALSLQEIFRQSSEYSGH